MEIEGGQKIDCLMCLVFSSSFLLFYLLLLRSDAIFVLL